MEMVPADILVIGAGGAGLRAAISIAETDPSLAVSLLSKVYPMRSHTVAAEGGAAGVIKGNDSLENHFHDTVAGGDWLSDQNAVELFVKTAPLELTQIEHWGCPWSRESSGRVAVRPFGGMKIERTWFAADKTGFHLLHTLFQTSLKFPSIRRFDEFYVTDLLVDDGRCVGAAAIEIRSGRIVAFLARAVIIATGGAGRVFPFTTNGAIKTGDGMAMAYRAGVPLKDMEFVQYHPTGLPGTGILITEGARGEGGILVNKDGYRYLQDYNLGPPDPWPRKKAMELGPRDRLSQAFWHEQKKGRTVKTAYGDVVHLDIRHLGEKKIDERLPMVRELATSYCGVDPVHAPIPVRPVAHYFMGGIHTDIEAATLVAGLFACGECACVSINGANRLGSNSLTELLVFGAFAGRNAAAFATSHPSPRQAAAVSLARAAQAGIRTLFEREDGEESTSRLRKLMTHAMETGAGIYRTRESLEETCGLLTQLRARYDRLQLEDRSNVFNTDLIQALELGSMLEVAQAIAHSALRREESRGSHQRLDYPERDDSNFLKHSLAFYRGAEPPDIDYCDVTITRSKPGKRVYGGGSAMNDTVLLSITRYDPEKHSEPVFQSYTVPYHEDWVVLDALNYIKDNLDGTLTFRWSCHMAVCGSCGMTINGEPKLSCHSFLRDYQGETIKIEPLDGFPIERDLVVVIDTFMDRLASVKPYLIAKEERALSEGEYLQTPAQLAVYKPYTQCINCLLCYAACPQTKLNDDFIGPAALALAHRYNLDSRDGGKKARAETVTSNEGIWECTFVGACSQVCPKNVDPAAAIQQTKISASVDWFKSLLEGSRS